MKLWTSAAAIKGNSSGLQEVPADGTQLREIYEWFLAHRGREIERKFTKSEVYSIRRLRTEYGLNIKCVRQSFFNKNPSHWILKGEWFGDKYISYSNEVKDARQESSR